MSLRKPQVAGTFYPRDEPALTKQLGELLSTDGDRIHALGILAPHAGYIYSGKVAGEVYSRIEIPETVVLMCPNHTGYPVDISIWPGSQYGWDRIPVT